MNTTNLALISKIKEELNRLKKNKKYFTRPEDFTRDCVFTFETVFFLIADLPRLSLSIEIEKSLKKINQLLGKKEEGTKSGFGKARKKIKAKLFEEINKFLVTQFYKKTPIRWNGFIVRGIDGSTMDIANSSANKEEFGLSKNQHGGTVQARMVIGYDVFTKVITHNHIGKMSEGEGSVVKKWISGMKADELNIYDRLYASSTLQYLHHYYNVPYVMRCKLGHNNRVKAFVASGKRERTEDWKLSTRAIKDLREMGLEVNKQTTIPVRMIRVELNTGEVEVLLTSLLDNKKYPHKIFKALYFKRWGVETQINFLKNTLQIEISSGQSIQSIYQDFYATIFRANVQALLELDGQTQVDEINERRKHNYAINRTAAAGNLKGELFRLFLSKKSKKVYQELVKIFVKNLEPIRLDRSFPRNKKSQKRNGKYKPFPNYKRAV